MTVHWLLLRASSLPEGEEWLGPTEKQTLGRLKLAKRRADWMLGRFTAKRALSASLGIDRLDRIEVIAASDGAPEAFVDGKAIEASVSISHRGGAAACAWSRCLIVGCDLEVVEPRTERFVEDFFTVQERAWVFGETGRARHRRVALVWSAKESALKAVRAGLRRDTRLVEVQIDDAQAERGGWHRLQANLRPEVRPLSGWWYQDQDMVLTVVHAGAWSKPQ